MAKLFKRGRIWYAWVRKRSGGVRPVSTLCTDKRAAEGVLAQLEREAVDPAYAAANQATTKRILDDYLNSRQRLGRSAGTLHHVRVKGGALLGLLPKRGAEITHAACERYIDARLSEGARRTTIKKELRVLKAALDLARRNCLFGLDPGAVIPELNDDYAPRERALTQWELVALVLKLPEHRAARVVWMVATGARWGESERAAWGDRTGPMQALRGTKTKLSRRVVPLIGLALTMVEWAEHRTPGVGGAGAPLFAPWGNVRRDLAVACARAGIPPVTPNDLRRTFSTWMRNAGIEPNLIGAAMGHTDSRMVERVYGRLQPQELGRLLAERYTRCASDVLAASEAVQTQTTATRSVVVSAETIDVSADDALCAGAESNRRHGDFQSASPKTSIPLVDSGYSEHPGPSEFLDERYMRAAVAALRTVHAAVYGGRAPAVVS